MSRTIQEILLTIAALFVLAVLLTSPAHAQTCASAAPPLINTNGSAIYPNGYRLYVISMTDADSPGIRGFVEVWTAPYGTPNRKRVASNYSPVGVGMQKGEGPWYVDAWNLNACGVNVGTEHDLLILDNRVR